MIEGTFEGITCNEWLEKVEMRNTGLTSKRCDDLQIIQDSEKKRIVVKAVNVKSKNKLNAGQIAGIVIVVVVIFVIRKKKTTRSKSEYSEDNNNQNEV